jgi:endonuclease III
MLALGVSGLSAYIRSIGLYNTKARHLIETCRILTERYNGEVPTERAALESLPGVGRKTANVILNVAFGESTIAVDTHIFRVANRMGLAPGRTPLEVERKLLEVAPEPFRRHAHHWLILHGRYVCTARKPNPCLPSCAISASTTRRRNLCPRALGAGKASPQDRDAAKAGARNASHAVFPGQSREQLRQFYVAAWRKRRTGESLAPLERRSLR